jgi:cytochrome c6
MRRHTRAIRDFLLTGAALVLAAGGGAQAADIFNGKDIYALHCQGCHGIDGRSMEPGTPDFTRGESLMVPDSELYERLRDGTGHLPSFRGMIEDGDLRDVIAYVRTLQR